jgi:FKBP-type peptidyl-prolyl cis-trans isomerase FklB
MNKFFVLSLIVILANCGFLSAQKIKTSHDSIAYIMGINLGEAWKKQGISQINPDIVAMAIKDVMAGKPSKIEKEKGDKLFKEYATLVKKNQIELQRVEGKAYMDKNKIKPGVTTLSSGLQYEILSKGSGTEKPKVTDRVSVNYHGTLISGQVFDSSLDKKSPSTFTLNQVIKGWTEGLQLMSVGDKFKFTIPSDLAYGDRGQGAYIGPGSTLIFEVELLAINP